MDVMTVDGDVSAADAWLPERLTALMTEKLGAAVTLAQVRALPGHAGLGFSFHATVAGEADTRHLVVRTIAADVPPVGPSDVVRQAAVMRSMETQGVPTPRMLWFENESATFGRPYFVGEFVEGVSLPQDFHQHTPQHARLARRGVEAMARLHQVDWRAVQHAWGAPRPLGDEFDRLQKLLDRPTIDPAAAGPAVRLRERLLAAMPPEDHIGCIHGDMHSGNMIFGEDDVRAVVDWEIAFVGSTLLDLGCIAFYADPDAMIADHLWRTRRWVLSPDDMIETYRAACGRPVAEADINWFRALAGYRFGVISLFNEMLHRRGKRHDPMWIDVARSVPQMMERGLELLGR